MDDLPEGLYKHRRQYRMRIIVDGRRKWKSLGDDYGEALQLFQDLTMLSKNTLASAIRRYKREVLPNKAASTERIQGQQIERLNRVFGHMEPSEITPPLAIAYLDKRGNVAGNREIALLRHILTKCVHWGILPWNQLRGLQYRNYEGKRDRDVESAEMRFVMKKANARERYLIWLIYLTGLRREDALSLTRWNCKKDEIHLIEKKTGKKLRIIRTTPLDKVVAKLLKLSPDHRLFPISTSGIDSAWQRLRKSLKKEGYDLFQLKDLRAAHAGEVEDSGGDATKQLGHSSRALTQKHYLRRGRKITPIRD